jgi:hypothetical protein
VSPVVVFVTPYFTDNARLYLGALLRVPGARVGVIAAESAARLPAELRAGLAFDVLVDDALDPDTLTSAVGALAEAHGPLHRLLGSVEQLQVPLGEVRDRLDLPGMRAKEALNFRDKTRMKDLLRAAGVPVARHCLAATRDEAVGFARAVGYPVVVKPPLGAASQTTYRVDDEAALLAALAPTSAAAGGAVLLEELVAGEEHSFDAFVKDGQVVFYSVSDYHPTPLTVMQNPWMQWVVVLPREHRADDIAEAGAKTLSVLGLQCGMCHLEWFRRPDGRLVVSEVGARPPGAQFPTMIARAHDVDCIGAWARLVVDDAFDPFPERRYACGAAYLRGQGEGRVRAVHGYDRIERELGGLITDVRLPQPGQGKGASYEGEGFVILRHPDTQVVRDALSHVISTVRVELG